MNKYEFLNRLRERLSGLPEEDIRKSLDYYSEIIDDRIEEGLNEEDAVDAVGAIDGIVSQILTETPLTAPATEKKRSGRALRGWEIALLILGFPLWFPLLAAAAVIVLAVYIVFWAVIAVLYAVVLSLAAAATVGTVAFVLSAATGRVPQGLLFLGAGLICAGLTILLLLGFNQITKGVIFLSKKIFRGIKACFVRKESIK